VDRLRKAQISALVVIAAIAVAIAVGLASAGSFDALPEAFVVITGIAVAAAVVVLGKLLFEFSFLRIRSFRRLMLGRYDIEGSWFNVMRDEDGEPVGVGVSNIGITRRGYFFEWSMTGEEYGLAEAESGLELNLSRGFTFSDTVVGVQWPRLTFVYEATWAEMAVPDGIGYGYLDFSWRREVRARRGVGLSFGMGSDKPLETTSFRLDGREDAEFVKQLDGPPGVVVKALGQLWDRYGVVRRDSASVVLGRKAGDETEAPPTEVLLEGDASPETREIVDFEEEWGGSNGSSFAGREN
jgi:hypothetical protein